MEKRAKNKPAANTRRHAKPKDGPILDQGDFERALRRSSELLKRTEQQLQRKEKIPKDARGGGRSQRMRRILKTPRLGDLPTRRKLLAAKCRAAGAKSATHLYLLRSA